MTDIKWLPEARAALTAIAALARFDRGAASIFGGSHEVQRNNIAKSVLGL